MDRLSGRFGLLSSFSYSEPVRFSIVVLATTVQVHNHPPLSPLFADVKDNVATCREYHSPGPDAETGARGRVCGREGGLPKSDEELLGV